MKNCRSLLVDHRGASRFALAGIWALCILFAVCPPARACGGLVQLADGNVGMDAQRAFYAVNNNTTELVVQIYVPSSTGSYGMLLPVPAQPVIDSQPVDSSDFDDLEMQTRPQFYAASSGGVGCGGSAGAGGAAPVGGVVIGETVSVGAVTAVSLSAGTGAALSAWLSQNGFVVPAAAQPVVNSYAGPGLWFVAIKRTDGTSSTASSIGVHLTLPGDQRGYALRMASIGAAGSVAITVFVADQSGVAPAAPFQALTLNDLNPAVINGSGYPAAVSAAVSAHHNLAFVVEGVYPAADVLSGRLATLAGAAPQLTRLSTLVPAAALTQDVAFTAAAPAQVPTSLTLGAWSGGGAEGRPQAGRLWPLWGLVLGLGLLVQWMGASSSAGRAAGGARGGCRAPRSSGS